MKRRLVISTSGERKGRKFEIREAFLNGVSLEAICSDFKVNQNFVFSCLKPKDLNQLSKLILKKLLTTLVGMTAAEIASEMGLEKSLVNSQVKSHPPIYGPIRTQNRTPLRVGSTGR